MKKFSIPSLVVALTLALPCDVSAQTDRELTYRENEIWTAAIRFLRVDSGFKILEKDRDAGYVLFEYRDHGKAYTASFEIVPTTKDGRSFVRARFQIAEMPRYVEVALFDGFVRKLKDEYGDPPPATRVQPPEKPRADGASKDADKKKGASQPTGKALSDDEADPDSQGEDDLDVTEDDLDRAAEEG